MPLPNESPNEAATPAQPEKPRRCRSLRVNGEQCSSTALLGQNFCFTHQTHGYPTCPPKDSKIALPLLEDHASIQLLLTQAAHGQLTGRLTPAEARSLAYICHVASQTLARPVAVRPKAGKEKPAQPPVTEVSISPDGVPLGPEQQIEPFEPVWSNEKFRYEEECRRLSVPLPTSNADLPPSGWLTEEEIHEGSLPAYWRRKEHLDELKKEKQSRDSEETAAALAAGLPDPHAPRPCISGDSWCLGPDRGAHCEPCRDLELQEESRAAQAEWLARHPGQSIPDLQAVAEDLPDAPALVLPAAQAAGSRLRGVIKLANPANPNIPKPSRGATQGGTPLRVPSRVRASLPSDSQGWSRFLSAPRSGRAGTGEEC